MRKKLFCSTVVVAASLFASSANAAQQLTISGPSQPFGEDGVGCTGGAPAPCAFTSTFNFNTPVGFNLSSIVVSTIASSAVTNIDFGLITFNGVNFSSGTTGDVEMRSLLNQNLVSGASNSLIVRGLTGGNAAFSGSLSFSQVAAIPEPATWMMMLLGFVGIGFTMRRKDKSTLQVRYT